MTNWIIKSTVSIAMTCMVASSAYGQEVPTPSRSVESFNTWTVECTRIAAPASKVSVKDAKKAAKKDVKPAKDEFIKICEAVQTYTNKKTGNK